MNPKNRIEELREAINKADAIVIGAGAGLSTSAGFVYDGERFQKYFSDFAEKYGFHDMYSGCFYPYQTLEEMWAYWSRMIYVNRYMEMSLPVYRDLYEIVKDKNYFVITTNVDHCFQRTGFDKQRLFYTQGDYGLFQCSTPCCQNTYDNEPYVKKMIERQNFMRIPAALIPYCPHCGKPMTMNLRSDDKFVQDEGWYKAAKRYEEFLENNWNSKILFLELGVGYNTPVIIKYPFWRMSLNHPNAIYACINYGEAYAPKEIKNRSICIDNDIGKILRDLLSEKKEG